MKNKRLFKRNLYKKEMKLLDVKNINKTYSIHCFNTFIMEKKQLECIRIIARRELKKKTIIRLIPTFLIPFTKKASGIRMGKGKGPINVYKSKLHFFSKIIEFNCKDLRVALKVLHKISYKLPISIFLYSVKNNKFYFINKRNDNDKNFC